MTVKNRILVSVCHDGPASQAELAKKLGLSASHVCEAVSELVSQGILAVCGYRRDDRSRGRKNALLDFNSSYKFALGVGLANGVLSAGVTTVKGDVLGKTSFAVSPDCDSDLLLSSCSNAVSQILKDSCLEKSDLLGVGVCADAASLAKFYPDTPAYNVVAKISNELEIDVLFEPAEEYLQTDMRFASISPEELYLFGAAKVIRDLLLYKK